MRSDINEILDATLQGRLIRSLILSSLLLVIIFNIKNVFLLEIYFFVRSIEKIVYFAYDFDNSIVHRTRAKKVV